MNIFFLFLLHQNLHIVKMYRSILIVLVCFQNLQHFTFGFIREALHDVMTDAELAYYFQTADKQSVSDYEVVDLPVVLPVVEAVDYFGDNIEEIMYSFSAFQR